MPMCPSALPQEATCLDTRLDCHVGTVPLSAIPTSLLAQTRQGAFPSPDRLRPEKRNVFVHDRRICAPRSARPLNANRRSFRMSPPSQHPGVEPTNFGAPVGFQIDSRDITSDFSQGRSRLLRPPPVERHLHRRHADVTVTLATPPHLRLQRVRVCRPNSRVEECRFRQQQIQIGDTDSIAISNRLRL